MADDASRIVYTQRKGRSSERAIDCRKETAVVEKSMRDPVGIDVSADHSAGLVDIEGFGVGSAWDIDREERERHGAAPFHSMNLTVRETTERRFSSTLFS